jgi:iron complex outermembrane recepter protein
MTRIGRSRLSAAVRRALLLSLLPVAVVGAQEDARTLDRVEVTGSRIKKAQIEGQAPVQVISRVQIEQTGLSSIGDVLQQLTASGSGLNTKFNSSGNFGFPPDGGGVGAGATTVDLRHLGAKRVLVLVEGIRWVNESSASGVGGVVDLNTIPLAVVERIEVLEDGASSIYGSDAIAGVVNIITRRSADGAQLRVQYGENQEGDGETSDAELSFGGSGDRHSFFLSASYSETKAIFSKDREISRFPVPGTGVALGSSAIPAGRFVFVDPNTGATLDLVPNAGVRNPVYDPAQTGCARTDGFHCFTGADRFNFAEFNLLQTPSKRKGVFGQARFDVTDSTSWYFRTLYNNRESLNQAAAEPFFLGALVPTNFWADNVRIPANHPFNPFGFDLQAGPGGNFLLGGRRPLEGGPRRFFQDVDTFYLGSGFEGRFDFGARPLFWDVNFARADSKAEQTNYGSYNARRFFIALGDPATCAANPGCTPLDIFGAGSITPAMLSYIQPVLTDRSENKLTLYSANLSGDLFDLPAGPLAFAAGYEYRKLKGSYRPDGLTLAGDYNGVPSLATSGSYDVNEVYAELNVPLLAGRPLFQTLDLSLAARYSDYSTFGGETTGKVGLRWQVNEQFLVRGTFAEGLRAPNIGELFGSASGFDAVLNDPCSANAVGGRHPNCTALGVPAGYVQPNPQISVVTGGNIDLQPETADSTTVGFVWSPAFATGGGWSERMDIEFTWYRHDIEGGIQAINAQTQLDLCVQTQSPAFCSGITRNSTGAIDGFANFLTNIGNIDTRGYDVNLSWVLAPTDWGQFGLEWRNTFVDKYEAIGANGARQPQGVGIEVANSAIPDWTSTMTWSWHYGDFDASWGIRHISDLEEACGSAATFPVCRNDPATGRNRLGSTTYHDLQVGYQIDWLRGTRFTAGVNNMFAKDAPICLSCTLNGYDASTYDLPGRFWYVRADFRF